MGLGCAGAASPACPEAAASAAGHAHVQAHAPVQGKRFAQHCCWQDETFLASMPVLVLQSPGALCCLMLTPNAHCYACPLYRGCVHSCTMQPRMSPAGFVLYEVLIKSGCACTPAGPEVPDVHPHDLPASFLQCRSPHWSPLVHLQLCGRAALWQHQARHSPQRPCQL